MIPKSEDKVRNFLKYSANRPYFGRFSGNMLNLVYQVLHNREYGEPTHIKIGPINGAVICNALWREMSLNPVRFGTVSPFVFGGANNIFRFVESRQENPAVEMIRSKLRYFLQNNASPAGQWRDSIPVDADGYTVIYDTCSGIYRSLQILRDCIKLIAKQNVSDYDNRARRDAIIAAVQAVSRDTTKDVLAPLPAPAKVPIERPAVSTYTDDETDAEERERELLETFTSGHGGGCTPDIWQEYMQHMLAKQH